MATFEPKSWYRDNYMISTAPQLIQPEAVNAAFDTEEMYWAKAIDPPVLKKILDKSLCFGLYLLPESSSELAGKKLPEQIGFARLITDEVTFAYLTDVYVLAPYRKLGLGSWMLECINDELNSWPYLRRVLLMSFLADSEKLYAEKLGMTLFEQGADGMGVLSRRGPGSTMQV